MKCIRRVVLLVVLFLSFFVTIYAEETKGKYIILDLSNDPDEVIYSSVDYYDAYYFYTSNIYNYQNLCMYYNDETILMEYGVLYIQSDDDIVTYYSISDEIEKALSNYNDYDLLYLGENNNQVRFYIGGETGIINRDEVIYYPYNTHTTSFYNLENDSLVHHISSSINNYYKYNLQIDTFPDFLDNGIRYYSYDNHYFYDDFYKMSDDYFNNKNENAVNKDNPYYNYYAYLPARSYTNYTYQELNNFITNSLGIKGRIQYYTDFDSDGANDVINRSEYYDNIKAFTSSEKIYGVNALTSLAWSSEESSFGKSKNAYLKSNVYNHEALVGNEIQNQKYNSVKSSIYSHMENYVSRKYCDAFSPLYVGSHIGDYTSGIASIYSYDPYYAEKVVSKAYFYDLSLGLKDKGTYSIAITSKSITLYYDKGLSQTYNTIKTPNNYSLIVLEEYEDGYKVQSDYSMNQSGEYNPERCIAYVRKDRIDRVIKGKKDNYNYYKYIVKTADNKTKTIYSLKEYNVNYEFVYKDFDGISVSGYDQQGDAYIAKVKKIKQIKGSGFTYPSINVNGVVINNARILIEYEDGSSETKNICGDYILSSSNIDTITNITLSYNGVLSKTTIKGNYKIPLDYSLDSFDVYNDYLYSNYSFSDVLNLDNVFDINNVKDISTYVRENEYDLNVAGVYPSFIYHSSDRLANVINTYYLDIKHQNVNSAISSIVSRYGLKYVDSFEISISRCFYKIDLISPIIMQVKKPYLNNNTMYTVYHVNKNGDIIKLPTQFSDNYVKFMTIDDGIYYVFSLPTVNVYDVSDNRLAINMDSNGVDYYSVAEEGIMFIVLSSGGYLLYALFNIIKRKDLKNWIGFKRLLQQAESVPEEKQNS